MSVAKISLICLLGSVLSALSACAVSHVSNAAAGTAVPMESAADPAGRMRGYQLVRRYDDVIHVDGERHRQTVEYGFDYDRRTTVRRIFSPDGELVQEDVLLRDTLRTNAAEDARLIELVRTHPLLAEKMAEPNLLIHAGGFVALEPGHPYCGHYSRCVRVVVSKGDGSIRHVYALVDLVSDRVIEPFVLSNVSGPSRPAKTEEKH